MEPTRPTRTITAAAAHAAVLAACAKARSLGAAVNACVVDAGGHQIAFLRDDGAFLQSGAIARDKAATAAGFGAPTGALYDALKDEAAVLAGISAQPGVALFRGGLPATVAGEVVGGIGVSGASADVDEICAAAGLEAAGLTQEQG